MGSATPEKKKKKEKEEVRHKLKDLFVSLPLLEDGVSDKRFEVGEVGLFLETRSMGGGVLMAWAELVLWPVMATLQYRLLRKAWPPGHEWNGKGVTLTLVLSLVRNG